MSSQNGVAIVKGLADRQFWSRHFRLTDLRVLTDIGKRQIVKRRQSLSSSTRVDMANSNIAVTPKVTPLSLRKGFGVWPAERPKPSSLDSF